MPHQHTVQRVLLTLLCCPPLVPAGAAELRIPAATAYVMPDFRAAQVSAEHGITAWTDPRSQVVWFGRLGHPGAVQAGVELRLPDQVRSCLRLTVAGVSREREVVGRGDEDLTVDFGEFNLDAVGYQSFRLESLNDAGQPAGDLQTLVLHGSEPLVDAHFNLQPRRNAASVHLMYPVPQGIDVTAFYCEMTGLEDPLWTYYMACGWHRGYFGMQINSPTERRIIFSVWDSGNEAVDRNKVAEQDRVTLVDKGEGVYSGSFGNEGTGGHSHLKFAWKTGEPQRFLVTAEPVSKTHTTFAGYYYRPDRREWMLISSWRAPQEGKHLRGLYSFSENFSGENGHVLRKSLYGNQWMRDGAGQWVELTQARFSHDATGKADRLDRYMGLEAGQFFLSHGGLVPGFTEYGTSYERPATGRSPERDTLPPLPPVTRP